MTQTAYPRSRLNAVGVAAFVVLLATTLVAPWSDSLAVRLVLAATLYGIVVAACSVRSVASTPRVVAVKASAHAWALLVILPWAWSALLDSDFLHYGQPVDLTLSASYGMHLAALAGLAVPLLTSSRSTATGMPVAVSKVRPNLLIAVGATAIVSLTAVAIRSVLSPSGAGVIRLDGDYSAGVEGGSGLIPLTLAPFTIGLAFLLISGFAQRHRSASLPLDLLIGFIALLELATGVRGRAFLLLGGLFLLRARRYVQRRGGPAHRALRQYLAAIAMVFGFIALVYGANKVADLRTGGLQADFVNTDFSLQATSLDLLRSTEAWFGDFDADGAGGLSSYTELPLLLLPNALGGAPGAPAAITHSRPAMPGGSTSMLWSNFMFDFGVVGVILLMAAHTYALEWLLKSLRRGRGEIDYWPELLLIAPLIAYLLLHRLSLIQWLTSFAFVFLSGHAVGLFFKTRQGADDQRSERSMPALS